ncbi:MAG: enoyl-CoA hydratase/isomerase family protein [Acidobacteria bacterium]|nr:enoyl-CoA hydratase/isomerase family protein [Acidobacteriota bacterium]
MSGESAASDVEVGTGKLSVTQDGAVATIWLENPGKRNAMTDAMWRSFPPLLRKLASTESVRVVAVRGKGQDFSAGADISAVRDILRDDETGHHDGGVLSLAEAALADFAKPTVALVEGYCMGGAWQIAQACDVRLASTSARFGITPAKLGIIYPLSGIERMVKLLGPATTKYLLFSSETVSAEAAQALGMIAKVYPEESFETDALEFVNTMAQRSQLSIHATKQLIDAMVFRPDTVGEENTRWQGQLVASEDPEIGVRAFLAKEKPQFTWGPSASD